MGEVSGGEMGSETVCLTKIGHVCVCVGVYTYTQHSQCDRTQINDELLLGASTDLFW